MKTSLACLIALMTSVSAVAATEAEAKAAAVDKMNQDISDKNKTAKQVLDGFQIGAGIGAVFMQGDREVDTTRVADGKLYVDYKAKNRLGVILEGHLLIFGSDPLKTKEAYRPEEEKSERRRLVEYAFKKMPIDLNDFVFGPMIVAELGDPALKSLGIGPMISFRRFHLTAAGALEEKRAFNIGVAYLLEQDAKLLADGFGDGLPLPAGSTDVRFKKETREGIAVVFSATF